MISVNLHSIKESANYLLTLKSKMLEGMIAEHLFIKDVLPRKKQSLSTGWFAVPNPKKSKDYLLFHLCTKRPSTQDYAIYRFLLQKNIQVYFVLFNQTHPFSFLSLNDHLTKLESGSFNLPFLSLEEFYALYPTKDHTTPVNDSVKDFEKQKRSIRYLHEQNILLQIALDQYFSREVLALLSPYVSNVDGFLLKDDSLLVHEIKFKYPTADATFGVNQGASFLFKWFLSKGLRIYHTILYNGTLNKNLFILDILDNPSLRQKCYWMIGELQTELLNGRSQNAPSYTQWNGRKEQKFIPIPVHHFTPIKNGVRLFKYQEPRQKIS